MADSQDLFAALEAAHQEIQEERRQLDAREHALQRAREELSQALGGNAPSSPRPRTRAGVQQKASQDHVDAISDYLTAQGPTRQADLGKALGLNSGTVSLALRQLESDGLVSAQPEKERNSLVWEIKASSPAHKRRRVATRA